MSSGNPFRASLLYNPTSSSPVPQTSFISADNGAPAVPEDGRSGLEDASAPPQKTKKHVRIESSTTFIPPHPASPDDSPHDAHGPRLYQGENVEPSPSPSASARSANTSDPQASVGNQSTSSLGWGNQPTADMWSSPPRAYQAPQSAVSPGGIRANPFSRTLASIEPQDGGGGEDRTTSERAASGNNRMSLDVESFKNLLMTGKAGPRQPGQPPQTTPLPSIPSGVQFESSSSTDTSSISRQSLFEHPQEIHPESPRTSYELAESDEDDSMGLVSEVKKGKKKPPPAPKHRHGKLVTPRQPQVVSFESFSASEPAPAPTTRSRENSDVNKPLPPTPTVAPPPLHISTQDTTPQRPISTHQPSNESLVPSDAPRLQKKTPPPVPLARRQSQLRTAKTENRSRSNSSLTMSSQHSVEAILSSPVPSNKDPLSVAKSPPPPPRSRHGARLADTSTSSANSSSTELAQRSTSIQSTTSAQGASLSRRSTLESESVPFAPGVQRSSSIASNRTAQRAVSGESTGSTMPPPPPPPRRRQSNRSSLDQPRPQIPSSSPTESRRTSLENRRTSIDSKRRTSMASESSLRNEYAPVQEKRDSEGALYSPNEESEDKLALNPISTESRSDSNNILDDMDKFQREIEELRQRYSKAA